MISSFFADPILDFMSDTMPYFNNTTWGMLFISLTILIFSYALRKYIVESLLNILGNFAKKTKTEVDDLLLEVIRIPLRITIVYFGILSAIWVLPIEIYPNVESIIYLLFRLGAILIVAWTALRSVDVVSYVIGSLANKTPNLLDNKLIPFVEQILKILVISIAIVMFLQELGYDPSGLLAGLGLGGLAFALAARDMLANFFGSIMLLTDKPFKVGDWISVKDAEGTVEEIGFRSTKIRLFDKSLVQVPNGVLASGAIRNFNRRDRRRIYFHISLTYQTTPIMMKAALTIVRKLIEENEMIRDDFYLVNYSDMGDSALKIMVYCFTKTTVWAEYLNVQEQLFLNIQEQFEKVGLEFAYPTMTVYTNPSMPENIEKRALDFLSKMGADNVNEIDEKYIQSQKHLKSQQSLLPEGEGEG